MKTENETVATEGRWSAKRRLLLTLGLPIWVYAAFLLAQVVLAIVVEVLVAVGVSLEGVSLSILNTVVAALVYALTLVIAIGVPLKLRNLPTTKKELGLTRLPSWLDILLAPISFVAYMLLAGILLAIVTGLVPGFDAEQAQDVGFENLSHYYEYALAFLTLVVVAPVAEEALVRGYLYGKLRKFSSIATATIVSALLFSFMHLQWSADPEQGRIVVSQWNVALNVLPLGIILAVLREKTGSIWAGILLHMLKNGIAFYILFINPSIVNVIGG